MSKTTLIKLLLASFLLTGLLFNVQPAAAAAVQQSGVCVWNGNVYYPGQYFYNGAGQQYLCYADGSYRFTGVTALPSAYYYGYPATTYYPAPVPYYPVPTYTNSYVYPYNYTYAYPYNYACTTSGCTVVGVYPYYSPNTLSTGYYYTGY